MEVVLFKTNVLYQESAERLATHLRHLFPGAAITFDLDDCDKVLRLAGGNVEAAGVAVCMQQHGFICEPME